MLTMSVATAEFERNLINERTEKLMQEVLREKQKTKRLVRSIWDRSECVAVEKRNDEKMILMP